MQIPTLLIPRLLMHTADTKTSNADTNTDVSSASDDTSSTNNEDNNDQSSNNNSNNPDDYDDLDELVNDIKNGDVDTDEISLSAFQDSGAYQGADQETQDCIDLAGKIGNNLGDQEIRNCSEDPNFYKNEISNNNDNNADDSRLTTAATTLTTAATTLTTAATTLTTAATTLTRIATVATTTTTNENS